MRVLSVISLMLVSAAVAAADVAGSLDIEVLPRFPDSQIVRFNEAQDQARIYPQGSIRRVSSRLRYEREIAAQGRLIAVTYELPRTHTADEAFTAAREAMQAQDAELLYWCQGRECGPSSSWANAVFGESILYGSDDQQTYALMRLAEPRQNSLLALYTITRGNRRAYLHAELLEAAAPLADTLPTPATLLRQLRSSGELRLVKRGEPSEAWVALLARTLNLDSTLRVSLSGEQAQGWRDALVEQRVRAGRLELGEIPTPGLQVDVLR